MKKRTQKGAIFALTLLITAYAAYWVWLKITGLTDHVVDLVPGIPKPIHPILKNILGLLIVYILSYGLGSLPNGFYVKVGRFLKKIPLIKDLYRPIASVMGFFDADNRDFKDVWWVSIESPGAPPYTLGFQTNDKPQVVKGIEVYPIMFPPGVAATGVVKWFPVECLIPANMDTKEGFALLFSAGSNYPDPKPSKN
jgi:uncharacterized membrane protein